MSFTSDPLAGATAFGFEIPQGDPGEMQLAASQMNRQATAFTQASENVRAGAMTAIGGWRGSAEAAFNEFAGHVATILSNNAEALDRGAHALARLATALESAQRAC